jgi:hypothetical protein
MMERGRGDKIDMMKVAQRRSFVLPIDFNASFIDIINLIFALSSLCSATTSFLIGNLPWQPHPRVACQKRRIRHRAPTRKRHSPLNIKRVYRCIFQFLLHLSFFDSFRRFQGSNLFFSLRLPRISSWTATQLQNRHLRLARLPHNPTEAKKTRLLSTYPLSKARIHSRKWENQGKNCWDGLTAFCNSTSPRSSNAEQGMFTRQHDLLTDRYRAAYCQIFDSIYLDVPMAKVKFNVNTEYMYIQNFKVLQSGFAPSC